jgi:mannose-6-phosphate isomerase-like protein (cupin superfamily)
MKRQNLFADVSWDVEDVENRRLHRIFWRPDGARTGATLYELRPAAPDDTLHMHYGAEEIFFVLAGRPILRAPASEEELAPGDSPIRRANTRGSPRGTRTSGRGRSGDHRPVRLPDGIAISRRRRPFTAASSAETICRGPDMFVLWWRMGR